MRSDRLDWERLASRMTYKPGWGFEVREFGRDLYLQIVAKVHDLNLPTDQHCYVPIMSSSLLPDFVSEQFGVWFIEHAIHEMEQHETLEWLKVGGVHVRDPHPELKRA